MAQPRDHAFSPISVGSAKDAVESVGSTPDVTLVTTTSSDVVNKASLRDYVPQPPLDTPKLPSSLGNHRDIPLPLDKDPFVTPIRTTRLSPTASTFTPCADLDLVSSRSTPGPISSSLSSDLGLSRILRISGENTVLPADVDSVLSSLESRDGIHLHGRNRVFASAGSVLISFSDIRDSTRVKDNFCLVHEDNHVEFVETHRGSLDDVEKDQDHSDRGQVLVVVACPPTTKPHESRVWDTVIALLETHGRLFALVKKMAFSDATFQAVAEFCSSSAASHALHTYRDGVTTMGLRLMIRTWSPGPIHTDSELVSLFQELQTPSTGFDSGLSGRDPISRQTRTAPAHAGPGFPVYPFVFSPQYTNGAPYLLDRYPGTPQALPLGPLSPMTPLSPGYRMIRSIYHSPPSPALTSPHSSSPSRAASGYISSDGRRQNAARVARANHGAGSHHNHVDTARIREGIDVRTTIMLRNIPNKVDQAMLKRLVDESSWGKYDFMYLRIDFANDCNVGYAFINFVDPLDIVDFVEARGNQRWNCFKSDKVAEISYATIQGKDCLVQKFRNSSVMLEAPHYRPKLYFTSNGPMPELAGQEESFPEPDNQSKMKRSCENAEHVGLFTPNAGQHFRDEQRRRRSQYDRGTRLAALEEYDYDTAVHHLCGAN